MSNIFDLLDPQRPRGPQAPAPVERGLADDFDQGLRAGVYGAKANVNKLAGTAMDAAGFDGSARHAASAEALTEARRAGSNLVPLDQVDGLRSGLRWAAGATGASAPTAAMLVGTGLLSGGVVPGAIAGTAALGGLEAGEMLQRAEEDPANVGTTAGERLRAVALPALGAGAVQTAVPMGVAARLAGRTAGAGVGKALARGAVDVPMEAVGEGGAEGLRQFAMNELNPNAGYDLGAIGRAAAEGAALGGVYGGVGAAGQAFHGAKGALAEAPGRAVDAVRSLAPTRGDSEAPGAADGLGGTPPAGPGTPDLLDRAGDVISRAGKTLEDIPGALRETYVKAQQKGQDWLDKLADGVEVSDPNAADPAAAQAQADQTAFQKASQWAQELLQDGALSKVDTDAVRAAATDLTSRANQQIVAGLKRGREAAQNVSRAVERFVGSKLSDAPTAPTTKPKKSEDYSGANKAIGDAVSGVLGADHPALADPKTRTRLADGLRPFIKDVADGRVFDSMDKLDQLVALFDVTGEQTTAVLNAVHSAVRGASKDETTFYQTLNQIDAIRNGRQGLEQTMLANLAPHLQGVVKAPEIRQEAALLSAWARADTMPEAPKPSGKYGPQQPIGMTPEKRQFLENQVRQALATRYGDKVDLVLRAVQANTRAEQNMIDAARVKAPLESDEVLTGDPANPGGREMDPKAETAETRYYPQNDQLYLDPELDDDPSPYGSAATRRMNTARKQNPNAAVRFRKASELGMDDPRVKAKMADLVDEALLDGKDEAAAQAWAEKNIDRFGLVTAEASKQETSITSDELGAMKLDAKRYGDSPSRIDAGEGVALDAVRVLKHMRGRLKGDYPTEFDDKSRRHRDARLFMEGIAAVQENLGRSFEVPDSTVIVPKTKDDPGLTWAEAKGLARSKGTAMKASPDGKGTIDDQVAELNLRINEIMRPTVDEILGGLRAEGVRLTKKHASDAWKEARNIHADEIAPLNRRIAKLLTENVESDSNGIATEEVTQFDGYKPRDVALLQPRMQAIEAELATLDPAAPGDLKRGVELTKELRALAAKLSDAAVRGPASYDMGRTETDPFGPTFDALGGRGEARADKAGNVTAVDRADPDAQIRTNADGTARDDTVMGRRAPAQSSQRAKQLPYMGPGTGLSTMEMAIKRMETGNAASQALARKMTALMGVASKMSAKDAVAFEAIPEIKAASDRAPVINRLAEKYLGKGQAEPEARGLTEEEAMGGPPSPKAVAAKQAAFLTKARSGDQELLSSLGVSTDAKGLQRAVDFLAAQKDVTEPGMARTLAAAQNRIAELAQIPDVAYGLSTKKYSLESDVLHAASGNPGFGATHDSPHKFDGFDWRTHAMKGEGAMVKGAGTYLSTSDAVHGYYKKAFTAALESRAAEPYLTNAQVEYQQRAERLPMLEARLTGLKASTDVNAAARIAVLEQVIQDHKDYLVAHAADKPPVLLSPKSPTYHLSVDIEPEQLMNWDRPLSEQSETVKAAALKAALEHEIGVDAGYSDSERFSLEWRGEDFYRALSEVLGGGDGQGRGNRDVGDRAASEYLQSLGVLGHSMRGASKDGVQRPNYVIYDDSKIRVNYVHFDKTATQPGGPAQTAADRKAVYDYLARTHGDSVSVAWANIFHAGEFERTSTGDVIRVSIHSLNPMSVAYHESLHAFFLKLKDMKLPEITRVLEQAANSESVLAQLRKHLAGKPEALAQLSDPEERAAYMYQFWAQGKLTIGPAPGSLFRKIADFIKRVTGIWTNDQRAETILEYFHRGDFEANRGSPSAVNDALMAAGRNRALEQLKAWAQPIADLSEAVMSAGGERLRDTGIPALRQLADMMKLKGTLEGDDPGFIPAARNERSRRLNQLGMDLRGYTPEQIREATEAMQRGIKPASREARIIAKIVQRRLDEAFDYMRAAGVEIERLGMKDGVPYFPRSWDPVYISKHQEQFLAMIDKYVQAGKYSGDPHELMRKLMVTDGSEFTVEVERPGMQNAKQRVLSFITHEDAAPFMRKELFEIFNSYVTQATRRAEWSRRFNDDGSKIAELLKRASHEGATPAQIATAHKYIRAVDGTLGDTINPTARRLMGNVIVYQNLRLLPLAIFSSTVDAGGIVVRGGTVSEAFKTFKRGMREVVKNFQRESTNDAMTNLAEAIGTIDSAILTREIGANFSQGMVGDTARKVNDAFFRFNLMEQYNQSMRVGATEAAMNFIVRHAMQPGKHSQRFLSELGLTTADVKLAPMGRLALFESDGLTTKESAKILAAVNRWVDGAVLRPDAADKPIWMSDPHWALIAHLKQFTFAFQETILKRVIHEARNGNYTPAMGLAGYVPMMIAADMVKGMIQGGGEEPSWKRNWDVGDYMASGVERAGLLGVGQFGLDAFEGAQRGSATGIVGSLAGPTIEQLTAAVQVLGGTREFGAFTLKSMPANALYSGALNNEPSPVTTSD